MNLRVSLRFYTQTMNSRNKPFMQTKTSTTLRKVSFEFRITEKCNCEEPIIPKPTRISLSCICNNTFLRNF